MAPFKDKWVRRFIINETARHKQGFTIYKVTSVIFLKSSPDTASKVSVWKRYNDFKKLHVTLKVRHKTLQIKEDFPPFPKPKFFGRFEAEVIEERRECIAKFLEFVARHMSLFSSEEFVKFFETSLRDDSSIDCSQSISSDTSEDDKSAIVDHLEHQSSVDQNSKFTENNQVRSMNQNTIKNNSIDRQIVPISNPLNSDSSLCRSADKESLKFNNNNVDKCSSEGENWQRFWSVEQLMENGKSNRVQCLETPVTIRDETGMSMDINQDFGQYILIAAAHMSAGVRHEAIAEYEEAFMQYKLGISNLRHGVHKDPDSVRRAMILETIIKYSERADRLYNRHLNCNISMINKPVSELQYYKVLRVIGSVMLVKDLRRERTRVIKTVEKPSGIQEDISKYILRGKVPYMVQLHACVQTETTVFFILQYASGGKLWDLLKTKYGVPCGKVSTRKKSHTRSLSCEAIIQLNSVKRINTSQDRSNGELSNIQASDISSSFDANDLLRSTENVATNSEDSLRKLEEEFGANSIYNKDLPTTQLLEKAQQLLKSVDATIMKSNSIASRLNESGQLLYKNEEANGTKDTEENTEESCDISELSTSDSCADLSTGSDKGHYTSSQMENICDFVKISTNNDIVLSSDCDPVITVTNCAPDRYNHETSEDSGIEMEQELWRVPEAILRSWTAQILLALEALHQQQVVVSDLRPENFLIDENSRILLSYVIPRQRPELSKYQKPYTAPEICMYLAVVEPTPAADIWSFGVILYELFTGIPFRSRHPGPFQSHSLISIPNELSENAKSLLTNILKFEPTERLTIPEIKQLPFFEKIDWLDLLNA